MSEKAGKLANPSMVLEADPRLDPRIAAQMRALQAVTVPPQKISPDASYEEGAVYMGIAEKLMDASGEFIRIHYPKYANVERSTKIIKGRDGNDLSLIIRKPADQDGPLPGVCYFHGGGMAIGSVDDPFFWFVQDELASRNVVVIGVEFRNSAGKLGNNPFPAGLNDCVSAVQWAHDHRSDLGIEKLTIAGESGGGNLSLATALTAKREGWSGNIAGVFANCPFISGEYHTSPPQLLSLEENRDYTLINDTMAVIANLYDPDRIHRNNPLAWPYHATATDLVGLPPHAIYVNELDPLRDEGIAYYRNLVAAGVSTSGHVSLGTQHAGELISAAAVPDRAGDLITAIASFAKRV